MKINFTILCLLFAYCTASSQTWAPDGAVWHYTLSYFGSQDLNYNTMTVQGDTVINGITCSRLLRLHETCNTRPAKEYMYQNGSQVYYWDASSAAFLLLYDFGKQVGETYQITTRRFATVPPYDTITLRVDSLYSIVLNGQTRQVQIVEEVSAPPPPGIPLQDEVIEGIGSTWQMFPWDNAICDFQYDDGLRCYQDSTIGQFNFGLTPICEAILLSTEEARPALQLSLFPNPAHEQIKWDGLDGFEFTVSIRDSHGKLVRQDLTDRNSLSIKGLANGVYFMEVQDSHKAIHRGKFLVLNP